MGCIGHELPYAFELDFPIQSPYALHSCGPWHSYNILSDDGSHALCFAAAPPFAFIKPRLLSTNKRFWSANPPFFFLVHKLLCHIWSGLFIPIKEKSLAQCHIRPYGSPHWMRRGVKFDLSFLQIILFWWLVRSLMQFWLACLVFYFGAA
jgi:hypothetical protein